MLGSRLYRGAFGDIKANQEAAIDKVIKVLYKQISDEKERTKLYKELKSVHCQADFDGFVGVQSFAKFGRAKLRFELQVKSILTGSLEFKALRSLAAQSFALNSKSSRF
jgi:chlorite dismutase